MSIGINFGHKRMFEGTRLKTAKTLPRYDHCFAKSRRWLGLRQCPSTFIPFWWCLYAIADLPILFVQRHYFRDVILFLFEDPCIVTMRVVRLRTR